MFRTERNSRNLRMKIIAVWEIAALAVVIGASLMSPLFPVARAANFDVNVSHITTPYFDPQDIYIGVGDTVTWHNIDTVPHTVASDTGVWATPLSLPVGGQVSYTFTAVNDYPYHCSIHPYMTGTVHVTATGVPEFPGMVFVVIGLLAMFLGLAVAHRLR